MLDTVAKPRLASDTKSALNQFSGELFALTYKRQSKKLDLTNFRENAYSDEQTKNARCTNEAVTKLR